MINNASAVLANAYSITASGTWYPTGTDVSHQPLTLSIPAAGTYLILADIRTGVEVSSGGGSIQAALFDQAITSFSSYPTQTPVANSERMLWFDAAGTGATTAFQNTFPLSFIYTASGAVTLSIGVMRGDVGTPTWSVSQILSNSGGETSLSYVQLSPAPTMFEEGVEFDDAVTVYGTFRTESSLFADDGMTVTGTAILDGTVSIVDGNNFALGSTTGTKFGNLSTEKIGFLGATPVTQQTGGSKTAAATYGANEQSMLQLAYNALRTFGLLS